MEPSSDILTPKEVAQYLKVSLSWVYKNRDILGGRKLTIDDPIDMTIELDESRRIKQITKENY